jgi:hypothetical protein
MSSFNVVIATTGRSTLQAMIDSIAPQLSSEDYLTLIWDAPIDKDVVVTTPATVINILNSSPLGFWGHASRTKWQNHIPGDYIINGDDDDVFTDDAMEIIREHCLEDMLYIFQMQWGDTTIPRSHKIEMANIGTPCGVYKTGSLPEWKCEYGGDFHFYNDLSTTKDCVFIDKVIYKIKP